MKEVHLIGKSFHHIHISIELHTLGLRHGHRSDTVIHRSNKSVVLESNPTFAKVRSYVDFYSDVLGCKKYPLKN